jgi:hypothetical protein
MNEKNFSPFVESLRRLYRDHMIQDSFLENKLADKRISMNEYLYIVSGKEV